MRRETKSEIENIKEMAEPLVKYLRKYYDPHTTIVITDSNVTFMQDYIGMPYPWDDDEGTN